jgi:quercetin dioxygenase-like cupin family protein
MIDTLVQDNTIWSQPESAGRNALNSIRPDEFNWKGFPPFPPEARLAIVFGNPSEPGLYLVRVKLPDGGRLMPHRHPENRIYTVVSGVFYIGLGEQFDPEAFTAYPPGSVVFLPGSTWHFHWARSGEYVTQVMGLGPIGMEYLDLRNDPRASA